MSRIMVDVETGEKYDLASYTTVEQQLAYKEVKDKEERLSKSENPFFFAEMDEVKGKELTKLDNKNLGWFLILQTYVDYKNMLRLPNAKLPMKPLEIRRALKITDSRTFKTLQAKLEELELIYTKDVEMYGKTYTAFFINDQYCFKTGLHGEYKNRKTNKAVKFFINTLQEVYSQEKVNSGDVGLIYKAIQHLHYNSNILVQTPSEMDEAFVKPLAIDEFAVSVGIKRQSIHKKLIALTYPCMYRGELREFRVFARVKVGKHTFLKLNPFIAWRKAGDPPVEAYIEFVMEYNKVNKK